MEVSSSTRKLVDSCRQEYGEDWLDSICYPLPPASVDDEMPYLKSELSILCGKVKGPLWDSMGPYKLVGKAPSNDMETCDVVSLLSGVLVDQNGKQTVLEQDTFTGRHVLVLCIKAPVVFKSPGFQSFLNLCYELRTLRTDVEMVMVARMNILADSKNVFHHLFSGFPPGSLAVPYEARERREHIWKVLERSAGAIQGLGVLYGTDGSLLTSFFDDGYSQPYGAEAFPFDKKTLEEVKAKRDSLRNDRLEKLLRPYESSPDAVFVHELNGHVKKNILDVMENKHIGLYVCFEGRTLIPHLKKLYEQWKDKFEIVVLYLPLISKIDPDTFKQRIDGVLQKQGIRGWCLPFNNSVSLRFWDLTRRYDCGDEFACGTWEDKLIIVGPDAKILDMYGADVIQRVDEYLPVYGGGREVLKTGGGIDAHPFTRSAFVDYKMKEWKKELRLESLLEGQVFFRGVDESDVITADALLSLSSKKKIIIYMGSPGRYNFEGLLISQYKKMMKKRKRAGKEFEVVFVEHPDFREYPEDVVDKFSAMPWYVHRPSGRRWSEVAKKLQRFISRGESLIGFGEDGSICSAKVLWDHGEGLTLRDSLADSLFTDIYQMFGFHNCADI